MPSNIAIIGNGNVGSALERGFSKNGYTVKAVGHDTEQVRKAAQNADVVVLAVPFDERHNALDEAGPGNLDGKTLIDVTNCMDSNGRFAVDVRKESGAEQIQEWAPGARVVKAFNTVFAQNMDKGAVNGVPLTALIASNDEQAKHEVAAMADKIGFDVVDAGGLENARWLEATAMLNINLGYNVGMGTDIGFRLERPEAKTAGGKQRSVREAR